MVLIGKIPCIVTAKQVTASLQIVGRNDYSLGLLTARILANQQQNQKISLNKLKCQVLDNQIFFQQHYCHSNIVFNLFYSQYVCSIIIYYNPILLFIVYEFA